MSCSWERKNLLSKPVPRSLQLSTSEYLYFVRHYQYEILTFMGCSLVFYVDGFTGKGNNVCSMREEKGEDVWSDVLSPPDGGSSDGGKQFMYKNTIKAASCTVGVCTVQLLEF